MKMSLMNPSTYPKNLKAHGWGWHRGSNPATSVRGFLKNERGEGSDGEPLIGASGSLYPSLPTEDDTIFSTGMRLYPALPAEEYESGAVEEVVEEVCAAVNVNAVVSRYLLFFLH